MGVDGTLLSYNLFTYCKNNPLLYSDSTGSWPELSEIFTAVAVIALAVAAVAAVVTVCAVAAPAAVAIGGTVISTATVASAAISVGTNALVVAGCTAAAALACKQAERKYTHTYSVYFLEDSNGVIQYVGRVTDLGYEARMRYHESTRGLTPQFRVSGLSYAEARGLEEIGIIECHTLNALNPQNNQIHGIGEKNKSGEQYMNAAWNYLSNRAENALLEILSW